MPVRNPEWEVSVVEVKAMLDSRASFVFIDVRETHEHQICRIDGANLIPLGELANHAEMIREKAGGKPVIAHCHHGGRSLKAASILREAGVVGAKSMAGGIDEWAIAIDSGVTRY